MLIGELFSGLEVRTDDPSWLALRICDITEDSRTALPGSLFIARKGEHADGREYIPQAIAAGAVAVLTDNQTCVLPQLSPNHEPVAILYARDVHDTTAQIGERFFGNPSSRLSLIGITGTNGKTTTAYLVHHLLNTLGVRCGMITTVAIDDGVELAEASMTTPPALEVSRTLARMLEAGCSAAVMEVSSHALHQGRVAGLKFAVGVFTNLTGDHLDYHGTLDRYADAKAMLFAALGPDGVAIVNADDPAHARMIKDCRAGRQVRAGVGKGNDKVEILAGDERSQSVLLAPYVNTENDHRPVRLRLVGPHNAMNMLEAVIAVNAVTGAKGEVLRAAVESATAPPGRLQPVSVPGDAVSVFVDYAHSDDSLQKVLEVLRRACPPRASLRVVFGCGGDRDRTKRPRMGRIGAELADAVVVTSDNPRTESPGAIIGDILAGVPATRRERVQVEADRERAIRRAVLDANPGDIVLIAGKGHETYQILPDGKGGTVKRDFDDRLAARRALNQRPGAPSIVITAPAEPAAAAIAQAGADDDADAFDLLTLPPEMSGGETSGTEPT